MIKKDEIVDNTAVGDPLVLLEILTEKEKNVSGSGNPSSPELSDPGKRANGFSIPCLGSSFLIVLPLLFVFTRRKICRD